MPDHHYLDNLRQDRNRDVQAFLKAGVTDQGGSRVSQLMYPTLSFWRRGALEPHGSIQESCAIEVGGVFWDMKLQHGRTELNFVQ